MAELKVVIPEDLKQEMDKTSFIDWSKVARDAIREQASKLARLKSIASKSKLTEKDALELGRKINRGLHERYKELYPGLK
ncbi:hypothetical protein FHEFKHOI_00206 [Candidatus Methanoperedenaceae archaeon GB50]|nr:hypothetical protein AIOGIFDO_00204 [Candidatus Methanoperedenaceae archaeon GB37]CAD7768324.1 hypothetical protein FHEFKHOI_00206 [Candidatus Methanoperedenaceae archaeon GB50]CAD7774446.1 MAG: hypothetical protein KBONHNOK_00713 [Candidatus Methanoperedenaceae archaeon GB50]